jgi:hypothetical protein
MFAACIAAPISLIFVKSFSFWAIEGQKITIISDLGRAN